MNKGELVETVAEAASLSRADAQRAVDAAFDAIRDAVAKGDRVQLSGFGTFEARARSERTGRNPQTGEAITIPASTAPAFKPGKEFKEAVNR